MSCPTCDHTLQTVFMDRLRTIRHCPRCGTMVSEMFGHTEVTMPKLIERHRELIGMIEPGPVSRWLREALHKTGVSESVLPPGKRPLSD